ncbi:MAG: glycosyltransferase family 2 protein [Nostocoides sp.]
MTEPAHLDLSVVLPCLNEAETVAVVVAKARASITELGLRGEVVVADNGSTDGSQELARDAGARVVDVPVRGYGAALQAGIEAAEGAWIVMADADDSYAVEDLGPFVEALRGGADLVMGNRFAGGIEPGAMPPLHRYLGNPVLSWLGRRFFRVPISDFHCGMRGFSRDRIRALGLQAPGMEFASEMVVRASLAHLRITEVATRLRPDGRSRAPHLRTWRDGWRHLRFMLAFSPRWFLLYPSLVLTIGGLLGMLILLGGPVRVGSTTFDLQTFIVTSTALMVGVQLGGMALIARAFTAALGMLPESPRLTRLLAKVAMERGLSIGAGIALLGCISFGLAIARWERTGFGDLPPIAARVPIVGMVMVMVGVEIIVVSFVLALQSFAAPAKPRS